MGEHGERLRGVALAGERIEHATVGIQAGVVHGQRSRQDDEVENVRGGLDAHGVEDLDEGAELAVDRVPRHNGHDDEQRADVEDEDAVDHLIDRLGNGPLGSSASPAVIPMSSMPPKENITKTRETRKPLSSPGKKPPRSKRWEKEGSGRCGLEFTPAAIT